MLLFSGLLRTAIPLNRSSALVITKGGGDGMESDLKCRGGMASYHKCIIIWYLEESFLHCGSFVAILGDVVHDIHWEEEK